MGVTSAHVRGCKYVGVWVYLANMYVGILLIGKTVIENRSGQRYSYFPGIIFAHLHHDGEETISLHEK